MSWLGLILLLGSVLSVLGVKESQDCAGYECLKAYVEREEAAGCIHLERSRTQAGGPELSGWWRLVWLCSQLHFPDLALN